MRLNRLATTACAALLGLTGTFAVVQPAVAGAEPASAGPTLSVAATPDEVAFFDLTNAVRAAAGVPALRYDAGLAAYAQSQAMAMAIQGYISHSNIANLLGAWSTVGENVGMGPNVAAIHGALVASPGHYANMVNPAFAAMGVGVAVGANGQVFTAHVFAA